MRLPPRKYPKGAARRIREHHNLTPQGVTAAARRDGVSTFDKYVQLSVSVDAAAAATKQAAKAAKRVAQRTDGTLEAQNTKRKAARAMVREQTARDIAVAAAQMERDIAAKAALAEDAKETAWRARAYRKSVRSGLTQAVGTVDRLATNILTQRQRRYALSVTVSTETRNRKHDQFSRIGQKTTRSTISHEAFEDLRLRGKGADVFANEEVILRTELMCESWGNYEVSYDSRYELYEIDDDPSPIEDILMRDSDTLLVDGGDQPWDTKQGRCVFDYLRHYLGKEKGFIKVLRSYETLNDFFNTRCGMELEPGFNALTDGVSSSMLKRFAAAHNMTLIGFDADDKQFTHFFPDKEAEAAVMFRVVNKHFYPIEDKAERNSRSTTARNAIRTDVVRRERSHGAKKAEVAKTQEKKRKALWDGLDGVVVVEKEKHPNTYLFDMCVQQSGIPGLTDRGKSKIYYDGSNVRSFDIGLMRYMVNQNVEWTQTLCYRMGVDYIGQSGHELLFKIVENLKIVLPKSIMNDDVFKSLAHVGVKHRAHYGCENGYNGDNLEALRGSGRLAIADVRKAFAFALNGSKHRFPVFEFHNEWKAFTGDFTLCGLYKVETDDFDVLSGNNLYSPSILIRAHKKHIRFIVKEQLIATRTLPATFFQPILAAFSELSNGDDDSFKSLFQVFSGYLGKTQQTACDVKISNCDEQIMNHIKAECPSHLTSSKIIMHQLGVHDGKPFVLYGEQTMRVLAEHNVPMYITMLDLNNVHVDEMADEMLRDGGTLAFRKTDCVVVVDGRLPTLGTAWGDAREVELPNKLGRNCRDAGTYTAMAFPLRPEFRVAPYTNSDQFADIAEAFISNGGGLLKGRAGTGKTYVVGEIVKIMTFKGLRVVKVAFTNKAARNIGGQTIHTLLRMDKQHLISEKALRAICKDIDFVIVDEVSMIPAPLLRALCAVAKLTPCKIILVGDDRQCPPVENTGVLSYFLHPAMQSLANNLSVELTVPWRYDMHMWDLLEDIDAVDAVAEFGVSSILGNRVNICWTNRMRVLINHAWMRHECPDGVDPLFLRASDKVERSQDTWVFIGMPVMAIKNLRVAVPGANKSDPMELSFANSDTFTVTDYSIEHGTIELVSTTKSIPVFTISLSQSDFTEYVVPAYASTVHKNQGDTILTDYTIWEWEIMSTNLRYTAASRAKLATQIRVGLPTKEDLEAFKKMRQVAAAELPKILGAKLAGHRRYDLTHHHSGGTFVSLRQVLDLHSKQRGECSYCRTYMKMRWNEPGDKRQLSINRLDNDRGHIEGNCELTCWGCNRGHPDRKSPLD